MITKHLSNILNLPNFMKELNGNLLLQQKTGNKKEEQINLLKQTINALYIFPNEISKDVDALKENVLPFDQRASSNGDDNRLSAFHYCYLNLINLIKTKHPKKACIYAMKEIKTSEEYIESLSKFVFVPLLYQEVFIFSCCEEYLSIINLEYQSPLLFCQIRSLENIGIALGVYSPSPDLLHWDDDFPLKCCQLKFELPKFTPPNLSKAVGERALFNEAMLDKLSLCIKYLPEGNVKCLIKMKLALFYFQNAKHELALELLLEIAKEFTLMNHLSRSYYCYILAYHCTSSIKKRIFILLRLLTLSKIDEDTKITMATNFNITGHHLLKTSSIINELKQLFTSSQEETISAESIITISTQPISLTLNIPLSLECIINNTELILYPDQPIVLAINSSPLLVKIKNGPTLLIPTPIHSKNESNQPITMECHMPEFIKVDKEWEGKVGVKIDMNKHVSIFKVKGKIFKKTTTVAYKLKNSYESVDGKISMKHGIIDMTSFEVPCQIALYLPIRGLSYEKKDCKCLFKCEGEWQCSLETIAIVQDPISFPSVVHPIHQNQHWCVEIPISNKVDGNIMIKTLALSVNNVITNKLEEDIEVYKNQSYNYIINSCADGNQQLDVVFEYKGKIYQYNNTIDFIKIPTFYKVQYKWDSCVISKGESVNVILSITANEDNKHLLVQVDNNDYFCVCGFNTRKIQLEVGEQITINYQFISLHAGICALPQIKFTRNGVDLRVEYENELPNITVLQESEWFDMLKE
ncbi:hypothetical protein EHI8A_004530 [Entamoeba histolytica HM-1:IMSS-B]|uniref:Trafficking protein particle complex subunit 11 C-terminal domain-containing protein n=4 Tax=Entamoeba histolytica TaxID=5759 RepID=C4M4P5_ENTH1|nr:hypothetical protein EHI_168350 [Entamoeba histolytica HM-1:IMSS]EAL45539.2 hypothetical protein EHI_168350 [Entamoeba histolytica HM-1:IMSS]EMH77992.1 hypothetical protein EHI8A_004530 [Entamoeba histolytica HM-1:IMSS-B]ENY64123.1 hypothetical protein EHI7A_006650 [Entamoeba histolytica HM-1:IMSS-A]GAT96366.1 hypothetical protein CL6EHI_168350 [Entamoeba histolytica]|eukprot:XP_650925.2 hypothetical protein EHI_168350 [Entamoeba histolytica HM-1:IMSS]